MNAAAERRRQDLARLQAMCAASNGRLRLVSRSGEPPIDLTIELACRTAGSDKYPSSAIDRVSARIVFPARYPFDPPLVALDPPVFHPNVYASGRVCLGSTWLPTEGLDLLVRRIGQIITFDPLVLNASSAANAAAAAWYRTAVVLNSPPTTSCSSRRPRSRRRLDGASWRSMALLPHRGRFSVRSAARCCVFRINPARRFAARRAATRFGSDHAMDQPVRGPSSAVSFRFVSHAFRRRRPGAGRIAANVTGRAVQSGVPRGSPVPSPERSNRVGRAAHRSREPSAAGASRDRWSAHFDRRFRPEPTISQ